MSFRYCNECNENKQTTDFTQGYRKCKSCRNKKAQKSFNPVDRKEKYKNVKDKKLEEFITMRSPIRERFKQELLTNRGFKEEEIDKMFMKKEDFDKIKNDDDYYFLDDPNFDELFKESVKEDFNNGYVLKGYVVGKCPNHFKTVGVLFII
jgi:hypothetical protein